MRLLITRSEPGATRMAQALGGAGLASLVCPLITAQPTGQPVPLPYSVAGAPKQGVTAANCFNHVIFVSEHAVQHGLSMLKQLGPGAQWYAIGPATAMALRAAMRTHRPRETAEVKVPEPARTEGLLEDRQLQRLHDQQVLLVAGENGRELLADTLRERGATVANWLTYRRVAEPADTLSQALDRAQLASVDGCIASSGQGLELLTHQWLRAGGSVDLPVCVPSPRVATMACELGWQRPVLCAGASAEATLDGLREVGLLRDNSKD